MKAEIKGFYSPDILDLERFYPESENNFCFLLELLVGPKNEKGDETFDVIICTPQWLLENNKASDIIFGRHYLIVFEYDFEAICNKLTQYVNSIDGKTWDEIALKVGRVGMWEFEDYQE
jgi:Immunity protein 8